MTAGKYCVRYSTQAKKDLKAIFSYIAYSIPPTKFFLLYNKSVPSIEDTPCIGISDCCNTNSLTLGKRDTKCRFVPIR